jgi:hypothetical protein
VAAAAIQTGRPELTGLALWLFHLPYIPLVGAGLTLTRLLHCNKKPTIAGQSWAAKSSVIVLRT